MNARTMLQTGLSLAGLILFLIISKMDGSAMQSVLMNLEVMTRQADRIVIGICKSEAERVMNIGPNDQRLRYIEYTFDIIETLKGSVETTLAVRQVQLGGFQDSKFSEKESTREQPLYLSPLVLPRYQPGQEVLIFLGKDSSLGLTSPVAMEQAVFDVKVVDGQKFLINRHGNRPLFEGMSATELSISKRLTNSEASILRMVGKEPIPVDPFVSLVKKLLLSD